MADALILRAEPRTVHGKQVKRLRREGLVPGVVYGPVIEGTVSVSVDRRTFDKFYMRNGHSTIFDLEWEGGSETVLIREVQIDPVRRNPLHIDFFAPNLRVVLRAMVPVVLTNLSDDLDGILNTVLNEVEIEALPRDLPHQLEVDGSGLLTVGDHIRVEEIVLPNGIAMITDSEETVATVAAQVVEEEPEVEETAEGEAAEGETDGEETTEGETDGEGKDDA